MKSLRYVVLLSLVVMLLASCVGLPPVFPNRAASPQDVEEPAVAAPAAQPPVDEAKPAITETAVVTATTAITDTAVIAATDVVTTTAPTEAQATPTGEQVMGANPLVGVVWEWAALLKTKPAVQSVVPDPASYTVVFSDDGKVAIKADCNNASGDLHARQRSADHHDRARDTRGVPARLAQRPHAGRAQQGRLLPDRWRRPHPAPGRHRRQHAVPQRRTVGCARRAGPPPRPPPRPHRPRHPPRRQRRLPRPLTLVGTGVAVGAVRRRGHRQEQHGRQKPGAITPSRSWTMGPRR